MPSNHDDPQRLEFVRRLKDAREYLDLSQDEVAKELGVPRTAISLMESGQRKVEALELHKLAKLYQKPLGFFTSETTFDAPVEVEHLARTAKSLSGRDREELTRFAEYLRARSLSESE